MQRRILSILLGIAFVGILAATGAWAGEPHFVGPQGCTIVSQANNCLTVAGKEAGLGDETQITVTLTADALCINRGNNNPNAANKADVAAGADIPVQNGKANYTIMGCAEFQPACSPPMTVAFSNVLVTDVTNGITCEP